MPHTLRILLALAALAASSAQAQNAGGGSGGVNAPEQRNKPYVILVSVDGFRWDYQSLYDTPAMDRIAARGVRADALQPVFPTLTFPNHYSIATGLYPANHGIVGNRFFNRDRSKRFTLSDREAVGDRSWYGGDPLWVVAERHGMVSAAYFFVGTEADVQGIRPTYWRIYNEAVSGEDRVGQVLRWLALPDAERPHLVTMYFEDVDQAGHRYGVGSDLLEAAVARVDGYLGRLLDGIAALPIADEVYVMLVSDHGMINYRRFEPLFVLADVIDLSGIRVEDHGSIAFLYLDPPDRALANAIANIINREWEHGQAVVPGGAPDGWHVEPGSRFADVIAQADPGYRVRSVDAPLPGVGDHGWAPNIRNMRGFFLAAGPRLPAGRRIGDVRAIDIYPLILEILGLASPVPIDGNPDALLPLLDAQ